MKRINAYETTDGKVFSDRKAAKEHQRSLNVAKSLRALAGTDTALADFLVNNADALKKALAGTVEEPKEEGDGYAAAATAEVPAPTVAEVTPISAAVRSDDAPAEDLESLLGSIPNAQPEALAA